MKFIQIIETGLFRHGINFSIPKNLQNPLKKMWKLLEREARLLFRLNSFLSPTLFHVSDCSEQKLPCVKKIQKAALVGAC